MLMVCSVRQGWACGGGLTRRVGLQNTGSGEVRVTKQCPKCKRFSVAFDYRQRAEACHWLTCGWVNRKGARLRALRVTRLAGPKPEEV